MKKQKKLFQKFKETFPKDTSKNLLECKANFCHSVASSFLKIRINNYFELKKKSCTQGIYIVGEEGKLLANYAKRYRVRV